MKDEEQHWVSQLYVFPVMFEGVHYFKAGWGWLLPGIYCFNPFLRGNHTLVKSLKLMHLRCYLHLNESYHLPMFEVQFGNLACKMDRKNYCKFLGKWMRFPSSNLTRIKYLNLIVAFFRKLNCNHSQKTRQASFLLLPSQFICKIGFRLTNHEALKFVKVGLTFVGVIRSLQKYSGAKNC